jgi:hypothetical protein
MPTFGDVLDFNRRSRRSVLFAVRKGQDPKLEQRFNCQLESLGRQIAEENGVSMESETDTIPAETPLTLTSASMFAHLRALFTEIREDQPQNAELPF